MRTLPYRGWKLLISDAISDKQAKNFFDAVEAKEYKKKDKLKRHHRSKVTRIKYQGLDLVLKVPLEKNNRKWIRLLTLVRQGESFKNLVGMKKLLSNNIQTTIPYMAAEKRSNGMVVNSWLSYEYIKGKSCLNKPEYYPDVVATLKKMHNHKLLHGDPQIRNFLATESGVSVIDSNPSRAEWPFDRAFEWAYLLRSCPEIEKHFEKINDWWLFKLARWYDLSERKFKRFKRTLIN